MTTTYVTFDTRSGRILSVHRGAIDAKDARVTAQHHRPHDAKVRDEHIDVIAVPAGAFDEERLYKLDVDRRVLIAATAQEGGVTVGFGEARGSPTGA